MKAIIVDDESLMMRKFVRLSKEVKNFEITGCFEDAKDAISFTKEHDVDAAFLDVEMPGLDGITLTKELRKIRSDIIIVFVTAFEDYIRESNAIGADYYLVKPYTKEILETMLEKIKVLSGSQKKNIYIQMFGRFVVKKDGIPIYLSGKAKEILALVATKQGREISNEQIYRILWEGRPYSNMNMTVYYNALRRLKAFLKEAGIEEILVSTARGQVINTNLIDCDYYEWKKENLDDENRFEGEFLSEYSWGESILGRIMIEHYDSKEKRED